MTVPEITIEEVNSLPLVAALPVFKTQAALKSVGGVSDGAGGTLRLDVFLLGNDTVALAQRLGPDGAVIDRKRVDVDNPQKMDIGGCWTDGTSFMIGLDSHDHRPINPRDSYGWVAEIEGWVTVAPPVPVPTPEPSYPMPCVPPGNRPYFNPQKPVTRAQLCKIVAIALGLPMPVAGTQTFEDIPEGSTFWQFVEAIYAVGAINGYPCTEGE